MRIGRVLTEGGPRCAIETAGGDALVVPESDDLGIVITAWAHGEAPARTGQGIRQPHWTLPLRPGKIVAIGLNYRDHAAESEIEPPTQPLVFAKFPSCVTGPSDPIVIDQSLCASVDWEVELGVVIGRTARDVPVEHALEHVFGYTVANDVSARDVQFGDGQWTRGKSFDTFCPLGPVVVTADEIGSPDDLRLTTRVNGDAVQDDTTASMIFGVAELIAFCSRSFPLDPGDLLLTGTPPGCGAFMDPPRRLESGDLVESEIAGIGVLRNVVIARNGDEAGPK